MNITETKIPDVTSEEIDRSKIILANSIIKDVYPLFNEVYSAKVNELNKLKSQMKNKRLKLKEQKNSIEHRIGEYKKTKKVSKLLEKIERLIEYGITYDGTMKHETVILLKIIDKLPSDKVDFQLRKTSQMINKRFGS